MPKKIFQLSSRVVEYSFYLLFILVPLVFSPWNFELFEFNKMLLIYILTTIIASGWIIKMILARKIIFKRSFWDWPLFIFFVAQALATIFSLDLHTSLWGYYTRAHGGLLSTISYLILYWAFVANLNQSQAKKALNKILAGAFLVASYGILEHLGIDKDYWAEDVQNRVFSTLGQPNWLAAYLVTLIFLPQALALEQRSGNRPKKAKFFPSFTGYWLLVTGYYLCLLFTKSRSGLLAMVITYPTFWLLTFLKLKPKNQPLTKKFFTTALFKKFLFFSLSVLILGLVINNPLQEKLLIKLGKAPPPQTAPGILISKSSDIRRVVWRGAVDIWRHYPLFGSGVETFAYSYYNFRPAEHNLLSEWDFLYNKAHNEYLNFLATTGIVGLGSYLLLIITFVFWSIKESGIRNQESGIKYKKGHDRPVLPAGRSLFIIHYSLLAGFTSILITNFFGFSVVSVALLFFLFPAINFALKTKKEKVKLPKKITRLRSLAIAGFLLFPLYLLVIIARVWYADFLYAKADKYAANDYYQEAIELNQKSVLLRPREPVYLDMLALNTAALAQAAFFQEEVPTPGEVEVEDSRSRPKSRIGAAPSAQLANLAIEESNRALEMNPFQVNFWKNRARVFLRLAEIDASFKLDALQALIQANILAPTDAKILYNLALIYGQLDQKQTARETLKQTITLKSNYKEARLALALYLYEAGDLKEAFNQLEYISKHIDPADSEISELIQDWQTELGL